MSEKPVLHNLDPALLPKLASVAERIISEILPPSWETMDDASFDRLASIPNFTKHLWRGNGIIDVDGGRARDFRWAGIVSEVESILQPWARGLGWAVAPPYNMSVIRESHEPGQPHRDQVKLAPARLQLVVPLKVNHAASTRVLPACLTPQRFLKPDADHARMRPSLKNRRDWVERALEYPLALGNALSFPACFPHTPGGGKDGSRIAFLATLRHVHFLLFRDARCDLSIVAKCDGVGKGGGGQLPRFLIQMRSRAPCEALRFAK